MVEKDNMVENDHRSLANGGKNNIQIQSQQRARSMETFENRSYKLPFFFLVSFLDESLMENIHSYLVFSLDLEAAVPALRLLVMSKCCLRFIKSLTVKVTTVWTGQKSIIGVI